MNTPPILVYTGGQENPYVKVSSLKDWLTFVAENAEDYNICPDSIRIVRDKIHNAFNKVYENNTKY